MDTKKRRLSNSSPVVLIFPDGTEFNSKTKAINYMNKSYSSSSQLQSRTFIQQNISPATTSLIDTTKKLNPLYSPFGLLEELFLTDPWRLLVSTICLNVTTRIQVDRALCHYLQRWPTAEATANANWEEISTIISPLGLGTKRAKGLIRFSKEYIALIAESNNTAFSLTEKEVKSLYNIGQYGYTAYKVFILKQLPTGSVKVCDHALQLYVEYQIGRLASESSETLTFS